MNKQKSEYITIYDGKSLENYLAVKQILKENDIEFTEKMAKKDNWINFLVRLFFVSTGSYGMSDEHSIAYIIEIKRNDYLRVKSLIRCIREDFYRRK